MEAVEEASAAAVLLRIAVCRDSCETRSLSHSILHTRHSVAKGENVERRQTRCSASCTVEAASKNWELYEACAACARGTRDHVR